MTSPDFSLTVAARHWLAPGMCRLVLHPGDGPRLGSSGMADEWLRLWLPGPEDAPPVTVSLRRLDPATGALWIDIALHEGGRLSRWAETTRPGEPVRVTAPRGHYRPGAAQDWQILAADAPGLPALARILEESPPGLDTLAFVELPAGAPRPPLPVGPRTRLVWLEGGNGQRPGGLAARLSQTPLPPGPGFVWVAAEQKTVRAIRRHLRGTLALPAGGYACIAYWIERAEDWQRGYRALDAGTRQRIDAAWAGGHDPEACRDTIDRLLEARGL